MERPWEEFRFFHTPRGSFIASKTAVPPLKLSWVGEIYSLFIQVEYICLTVYIHRPWWLRKLQNMINIFCALSSFQNSNRERWEGVPCDGEQQTIYVGPVDTMSLCFRFSAGIRNLGTRRWRKQVSLMKNTSEFRLLVGARGASQSRAPGRASEN